METQILVARLQDRGSQCHNELHSGKTGLKHLKAICFLHFSPIFPACEPKTQSTKQASKVATNKTKPSSWSLSHLVNQPANQPVNQSGSQPTKQANGQPANW